MTLVAEDRYGQLNESENPGCHGGLWKNDSAIIFGLYAVSAACSADTGDDPETNSH
jgi:hypothetical protein